MWITLFQGDTEPYDVQYFQKMRFMMSSAGFNLRAGASNSKALNRKAQEDGMASSSQLMSVLGLQWNTASDQVSLTPKMIGTTNRPLTTKREVLKDASTYAV